MIELAADRGRTRHWIICETGDRWLHSIRRFAPAMMPSPLIPVSLPSEPANVRGMLHRAVPAVVFWEVQRKSLAIACDYLAQTAINAPRNQPTKTAVQVNSG